MSEYLSDFVQDSQEQITALNNSLLTLERSPDDEAALRRIFRAAHTLKGNCGAMGFERASELAHVLEDLLDDVRAGNVDVTADLMDTIFDGVDELEAMIDEVASSGQIGTDPTETIKNLRARIDDANGGSVSLPDDEEIDTVLERLEPPADDDHDAFFVRLSIDEDDEVNNGLLVIEALSDAFEVIGTDPPREAIEDRTYDRVFDAVFASPVQKAAIAAALEPVEAVVDFEIVIVTDRFGASKPDVDAEPEAELSSEDANELSVDELLDEVSEFDDLDAMVDEVEDVTAFENMGDAGSFDDLLEEDEFDELATEPAAEAKVTPDADGAEADSAPDRAQEQVDDASAVFAELQDEVEMVGFDELQDELDELEFDEFDDEEEVSMEELLGDDLDPEDDTFLDDVELDFEAGDVVPEDDVTVLDDVAVPEEPTASDVEDEVEVDAFAFDDLDGDEGVTERRPEEVGESEFLVDDDLETESLLEGEAIDAEPEAEGVEDGAEPEAEGVEDGAEPEAEGVEDGAEPEAEANDLEEVGAGDEPLEEAADVEPSPEEELAVDDSPRSDETEVTVDDAATAGSADEGDSDWSIDDSEAVSDELEDGDGVAETDELESGDETIETDEFADAVFGTDGLDEAELATEANEFSESVFGNDGFDSADPRFDDTIDVEDDSFDDTASFDDTDSFDHEESEVEVDDEEFGEVVDDESTFEPSSTEFDPTDGLEEPVTDAEGFETDLDDRYASLPDSAGFAEDTAQSTGDSTSDDDGIQSVRVDVDQIDTLLTLVEGLVTSRVRLRHAFQTDADLKTIDRELDDLEDLTTELQETVMDVRLVPLETAVNRLPRVVRDVAREQEKEVVFELEGEDVELDRSILDEIGDPLIHVVRNAVDHGIEPPERREDAGKPWEGTVELRADRSRDRVTIEVEDDGSGLDPDRLRAEAVGAGILSAEDADALDDEDAYDLVFHPGLSTAEEVTDISGRGVGMDVVKQTVESLEGTVDVESEPGKGTTFTLSLPVTMAIEDVLFVESGGEEFGVPTKVIGDVEAAAAVEVDDEAGVLEADDVELSVVDLAGTLGTSDSEANDDGMFVRIRDDVRPVAIRCDEIRGQQEVVVKPFEGFMSNIPGLSGATVRGRGEVVNILDVTSL